MIFPVTGFPCSLPVQKLLPDRCIFRSARFVVRDFRDSSALLQAIEASPGDIFVVKAAWLSEILYRVLERTKLQAELPAETQRSAAQFLGLQTTECGMALTGLLWLSAANPLLAPLARCFAGSEKIPQLAFLAKTAVGQRLLRLILENNASIDAQLEALILHVPGVLNAEERDVLRRLVRYDRSAQFTEMSGGGVSPAFSMQPGASGGISRSSDSPWMRELVLLAKIVPVWLAELSRRLGRGIDRLDEIPEEEIARIAGFGVNGIWLVGLWQRSAASARIKALTGGKNYSSAYSVFDYRVADEWGGDEALVRFRTLCARYGIRLGCDMVPNHTGIDSKWMREHPDWFIQTETNPFPAYSFHGENLSAAPGIEIRIEDHYYDKSDAAVVFACDRDGKRRYIYHGNDGTGLPWNDTAQLDHTNAEVRRALIDTALCLAENFSIIRFDAAMTLTRDHYRRLWFPPADAAPAIASRSVYGMAAHEFDARMPAEFWTELVNEFRMRQSDTLLVAEAFWMTEMYFVRSLGMHRVYNSAFMHALRDEKNAEFEANLKNFREHDADTLSRFVNYLSTPDEESAAACFPNDEKYLGAMLLMATLPGLPMLAPGQLEGYREKYGMDQESPHLNEPMRDDLAAAFSRRISPLLQKRAWFSFPQELQFPACEKPAQCIVYIAGSPDRHLIVFNNSAHGNQVVISGWAFCALFPEAAVNLAWTNFTTGQIEHGDKNQILSQGYKMQLRPYESAVFSGFTEAPAVNKPAPKDAMIPANRHYSGVAVPVAALRSRHSCGIGEFADLKLLVDWCAATGQSIINLLPVNDTGMNSSPYSALSAMALHPVYMRLDEFPMPQSMKARIADMRLAQADRPRVAFQEIAAFKEKILREIYFRDRDESIAQVPREFRDQRWLVEYAVYRHLKDRYGGSAWFQWNADEEKSPEVQELPRDPEWFRIEEYFVHNIRQAGFYVWLQYHLHRQLTLVKAYADQRGIFLKGDMPIMLERDSVDVWLNPGLFNHHLRAGAPPDMFSPEGQNWGFPVYNWPAHERQNFSWWRARITQLAHYFSAYRIDHVLGFFRLWCIEEGNYSGRDGFFQPAAALHEAHLREMGLSAEHISSLCRVRIDDSDISSMPAETIFAENGTHWLNDTLTHENGITTLGLRQDLQDKLWQRLHGRPLLKVEDRYYPAWAIGERLASIENMPQNLKQVLIDSVARLQGEDAPRQQAQGQKILSVLREAAAMLPCAEDLGVVPEYVRPTLAELGILCLKVYRWEAENNIPKDPQGYPFLSLATSSVHDSSNLREWLAAEPASVTGMEIRDGHATTPQIREFLLRLYRSPAMVVMIPLQDLLALDAKLHGDAAAERINIPGTVSDFNWTYRMPLNLEDLLYDEPLRAAVRDLVSARPVSA